MPKDYKHINQKKKQPATSGVQGILPFTTGLVIGLFVAFIVYLNEHQADLNIAEFPELIIEDREKEPDEPVATASEDNVPEPQFDFYQILPNMEVNVSEWEAEEQDKPEKLTNGSNVYVLQVGSFREYEAADEVKAQLALLGVNADIQRVVINGRDIRYRVRVGPYEEPEKLNVARDRLVDNNLEFIVLKLKVDDI